MRIGEIAVVGNEQSGKREFIEAICDEIDVHTDNLIFGRLQIDNQLVVHLYGVEHSKECNPSWDLVSKKLLGYVVLMDWQDQDSRHAAGSIVDNLTSRYTLPIVVAAKLKNNSAAIPEGLLNIGFSVSEVSEFTFFRLTDPQSVKKVLIVLLDSVIDKIN